MAIQNKRCDVCVIGGGAAGLSAAVAAAENDASVIVIEREDILGGILQQCIHNGFGLHRFGEELTGPEFAKKDADKVNALENVDVELKCSALSVEHTEDGRHVVTVVSETAGLMKIDCAAVVMAAGCRERTRGQINIAGGRPSGVFTAGSAQKLINHDGALVGKKVVILGSGDIGLIMARRMTWEGAEVLCVNELMSEPGGLRRNIVQCLDDYNIPLNLSTTVTRIIGKDRLEAVELADVEPGSFKVIPGTERIVECDALLLSVGLIPENAIAEAAGIEIDRATAGPVVNEELETNIPGVFAAGNELHVHDLADFVSEEGTVAGAAAARYAKGIKRETHHAIEVKVGENVGNVTPHHISDSREDVVFRLRSRKKLEGAYVQFVSNGEVIKQVKKMIIVPSEMLDIKLTPKVMEQAGDTIEVRISETKA